MASTARAGGGADTPLLRDPSFPIKRRRGARLWPLWTLSSEGSDSISPLFCLGHSWGNRQLWQLTDPLPTCSALEPSRCSAEATQGLCEIQGTWEPRHQCGGAHTQVLIPIRPRQNQSLTDLLRD